MRTKKGMFVCLVFNITSTQIRNFVLLGEETRTLTIENNAHILATTEHIKTQTGVQQTRYQLMDLLA